MAKQSNPLSKELMKMSTQSSHIKTARREDAMNTASLQG